MAVDLSNTTLVKQILWEKLMRERKSLWEMPDDVLDVDAWFPNSDARHASNT